MVDFGLNLPIVGADEIVEQRTQIVVDGFVSGFSLPTVKLVYLTGVNYLISAHNVKKN